LWLQDSLWKMALLGGIITASVQTAGGVQPLGGRIALGSAPVVVSASLAQPQPQVQPVRAAAPETELQVGTLSPIEVPLLVEQTAVRESSVLSSVPWFGLGVVLAGLGIGIAMLLLVRRGVALWQLQVRLAGRTAVTEPELVAMVDELRHEGGLQRRVRLSSGPHLTVPLAMGLWRPEICLPQRALYDLSREQQRVVLAHEMAHLVRRDPTWLLLCRVIESVLFFQPLNRLAAQRLQVLSEYLCDDWSVGLNGRLLVFARCLTEVAGWVVEEGPAMLPCMARPGSELSRRIGRLLEQKRSPWTTTRPRWLSPLLGGVLLAVAACAPRVCQVAVASPLPGEVMPALASDTTEPRYLLAVADAAPRAVAASPARLSASVTPSVPAQPAKGVKGRALPPQRVGAPVPPHAPTPPHEPQGPEDFELPEPPEAPEAPEAPEPPAMPAAPRMSFAAAPAAPAAPFAPAAHAEMARLAQEQERLAREITPAPEQLALLNEKAAALTQAFARHDQAAQQRLQRELSELSSHMRPSPEVMQRLRELGRQLGQQGRQLAQLAAERAHLEQEMARLEQDRARLEQDRARLAAELKHLDAATAPHASHPAEQP
jgi:chorismate mutase